MRKTDLFPRHTRVLEIIRNNPGSIAREIQQKCPDMSIEHISSIINSLYVKGWIERERIKMSFPSQIRWAYTANEKPRLVSNWHRMKEPVLVDTRTLVPGDFHLWDKAIEEFWSTHPELNRKQAERRLRQIITSKKVIVGKAS